MKRAHENIKEFKNGNLSIRFPIEYRDKLKSGVGCAYMQGFRMKMTEKLLTKGECKNERI